MVNLSKCNEHAREHVLYALFNYEIYHDILEVILYSLRFLRKFSANF